jgi:hypothetical protein
LRHKSAPTPPRTGVMINKLGYDDVAGAEGTIQ